MFGIFENTTIFKGRLTFKFEKMPYYQTGGGSILNKVIIDLGFTKFVSRISNKVIDLKKVELVNKYTGGVLGTYTFPKEHSFDDENDYKLKHSFLSLEGEYIGDATKGWWYFNNNMLVCKEYPNRVAIILKRPSKDYLYLSSYMADGIIGGDDLKGYYGYSHRGGQMFKIGDRIFDESYEPKKEDYPEWQWEGWSDEFEKKYTKGDDFDRKMIYNEGVKSIIPFTFRGRKVIENWNDALQAALNFANYLS